MPEELEEDLMAVLNHGGLSAEKSEAVALLLVHAPLSENPHIANHLGFADKPELLREVTEGRQAGNLPLKFFGLSADGRRLQSSGGSSQSGNGPSTQLVVMGFMNKVLGALTSDFQHALNNTGFFTLGQAITIRDIVVNIWSDDGKSFLAYPDDASWSAASGIPISMCGIIRAMKNNVPTAEYQLNFVQDINLMDPTQRQLWTKTALQLSEAAIKDKRYELLRFGATRAQVDALYDFIYKNQTVSPAVYLPAVVDLVA